MPENKRKGKRVLIPVNGESLRCEQTENGMEIICVLDDELLGDSSRGRFSCMCDSIKLEKNQIGVIPIPQDVNAYEYYEENGRVVLEFYW